MKSFYKIILLSIIYIFFSIFIFLPKCASPNIVKFLIISQILFIISVLIFWLSKKSDLVKNRRNIFYLLIFISIAERCVIFFISGDSFFLSDDIYRYVWDGSLNLKGINPYNFSPGASELKTLRDEKIYPKINHSDLKTIYPPVAQYLFTLAVYLGGMNIWSIKILCAVFELVTIIILFYWLKKKHGSMENLLIYLYSPLIIIEFYSSAHLDILAIPFLIAGLIILEKNRPCLTGFFFALASLIKFFGLFFVPLIFFDYKNKARLIFSLSFILTCFICYLPFITGSENIPLGSLFVYIKEWYFNGSIFQILTFFFSSSIARSAVYCLFISWIIYLIARKLEISEKLYRVFAGYIILTPTLYPWYLAWLYPFLLLRMSPAFLSLTGTTLLSYHYLISFYEGGIWKGILWLEILSYIPFYFLLVFTHKSILSVESRKTGAITGSGSRKSLKER